MGCLSVKMTRVSGLSAQLTRVGGMSVTATRVGGMNAYLAPICAVDVHDRIVFLLENDQKYLFDSEHKQLKTIR